MALALAKGLQDSYELEIVGRDKQKLADFGLELQKKVSLKTYNELKNIDDKNLILCIKPYALKDVSSLLNGEAKSLISVMAGVSIEVIRKCMNAKEYVRGMPNVAASFGKSSTALCGDEGLKSYAQTVFEKIGKCVWLGSEKELNIATALGGSAPAFLALVAESLIDAGVKEGLKREDAKEITVGLFDGFAELLKTQTPTQIKEAVMSPGGTTAAGFAALEKAGARSAFFDAIKEATRRAEELSK